MSRLSRSDQRVPSRCSGHRAAAINDRECWSCGRHDSDAHEEHKQGSEAEPGGLHVLSTSSCRGKPRSLPRKRAQKPLDRKVNRAIVNDVTASTVDVRSAALTYVFGRIVVAPRRVNLAESTESSGSGGRR